MLKCHSLFQGPPLQTNYFEKAFFYYNYDNLVTTFSLKLTHNKANWTKDTIYKNEIKAWKPQNGSIFVPTYLYLIRFRICKTIRCHVTVRFLGTILVRWMLSHINKLEDNLIHFINKWGEPHWRRRGQDLVI